MKFKEIKPGMVIHCPKENEKDVCFGYLMERDDLDFTYTNPEDEVGWFFFVCDRMGKPEDMSEEITEFSDLIEADENLANKANDLANSLDNQDNDLDNQRDNEMSVVEVLEWIENSMSKSILTVTTPKDCVNCVLCHRLDLDRFVCQPKGKFIQVGEKAEWCPLKPMLDDMEGNTAYAMGWNDYRDAIGGNDD